MRVRIIGIVGLVVSLTTGCAGGRPSPLPSAAASPPLGTLPATLSPEWTPSAAVATPIPISSARVATPGPTIPTGLSRTAAAEEDGIRVEIELQRNPIPAGELSWVMITVTNLGRTDVTWLHDGCPELASVRGASAVAWSMGEAQPGNLAKFKKYALSQIAAPSPFATFWFVPQDKLGIGSYGCGDVAHWETLAAGERRQQTRWWSGVSLLNRALLPAGPATLSVSTADSWRDRDPDRDPAAVITFEVPAWIEAGDSAARLSPAEIVDRALADQEFAGFLETQNIANGRASIAWYQPDRDIWEVGILPWYETVPPRIHGVVVDAKTGAILGRLDRAWKRDLDGMP